MDSWRRVCGGRDIGASAGWAQSRAAWGRGGFDELAAGVVWILRACGTSGGVGEEGGGELWLAGSSGGTRVGTAEYRGVWRRRRERDDLRGECGIVLGERADGVTAREGPVSQSDRREWGGIFQSRLTVRELGSTGTRGHTNSRGDGGCEVARRVARSAC